MEALGENRADAVTKTEDDVGGNATDEAVRNWVGEGHQNDGDEGWDGLPHVLPFHLHHRLHHQHAHQHQRRPHGPCRNRRQKRRQEERQHEVARHRQRRHPCSSPLLYPRRRLDERRHWWRPQKRPHHDGQRIRHKREILPLEVAACVVHAAGEPRHGVERPSRVQNVHVEEGHESLPEARGADAAESERPRGGLDAVHVDHLLEVAVCRIPDGSVWEGSDGGAAEPGDSGDKNYAVNHGSFDVFDEADWDYEKPGDSEPEGWRLHSAVQAEHVAGDRASGDEGDRTVGEGLDGGEIRTALRGTGGEGDKGGGAITDEAHALVALQPNEGEEETDAGGGGNAYGFGHQLGKPSSESQGRYGKEEEALEKDSS